MIPLLQVLLGKFGGVFAPVVQVALTGNWSSGGQSAITHVVVQEVHDHRPTWLPEAALQPLALATGILVCFAWQWLNGPILPTVWVQGLTAAAVAICGKNGVDQIKELTGNTPA